MIIALPLLVALIGMLMFAFCANPKLVFIGQVLFAAGILAFLLQAPAGMREIGILPKA